MKSAKVIDLVPVTRESLTPAEFLKVEKKKDAIKSVRFVPPRIGDGTFGRFDVEYNNSKLVPA